MRVCIDIQAAIAQRAGVGRYTKSLVEHLGEYAGEDELALFYFDFKRKGTPFPVSGASDHAVRWCPGRYVQYAWKTLGWPPFNWFVAASDVYHFPNFIRPPLSRGRSVVTIHDVAFLRHPETLEPRNHRYLTACIRNTVAQADAIITVSEFTAHELQEMLQVPPDRLFPIAEGLTGDMERPEDSAVAAMREAHQLRKPYLLAVGTLEPRKNIPLLVDVFERLDGFDGDLVIAGMRGWKYEPILERMRRSPRAASIRYLEFVEDRHLPALYAGAELFVFPSLYEGFGFPPLEAMACGTPVVASAAGSLPEVLGDAAVIVHSFEPERWVATLEDLLGDRDRLDTLRVNGVLHTKQYSWTETARKTWEVYRNVTA